MKKLLVILACWLVCVCTRGEDGVKFLTTSDEYKWEVDWGLSLYQDFNTSRFKKADIGTYLQVPAVHYKYVSIGAGYLVLADNVDRSRPMFTLMVGKNGKGRGFLPRFGIAAVVGPYEAISVCVDVISLRF